MNQLRFELLMLTLTEVIQDVMPEGAHVLWTEQSPERSETDFATMQLIAGPVETNRQGVKERGVCLPADATLTITSAAAGRYYVRVNGVAYWYDATGADTVTTIRDGLANELQREFGTEPHVVALDTGADQIRLVPDEPGGLYDVAINGNISGTSGALSAYKFSSVSKRFTVNIQTYSHETSPRLGASLHMQNILSALERSDVCRKFADRCIGIWSKGTPVRASVLVGTTSWESRSSLDVDFALRSVTAQPVESIDSVSTTIEGSLVTDGPVVSTSTFTTP